MRPAGASGVASGGGDGRDHGEKRVRKSTLLNVLGGLMAMDSGSLRFRGELWILKKKVLTHYRRNSVGFVVQYFALIPDLNISTM